MELGRDFGNKIEINKGVTADSLVIGNPGERIFEGTSVEAFADPASSPAKPAAPTAEKVAEAHK